MNKKFCFFKISVPLGMAQRSHLTVLAEVPRTHMATHNIQFPEIQCPLLTSAGSRHARGAQTYIHTNKISKSLKFQFSPPKFKETHDLPPPFSPPPKPTSTTALAEPAKPPWKVRKDHGEMRPCPQAHPGCWAPTRKRAEARRQQWRLQASPWGQLRVQELPSHHPIGVNNAENESFLKSVQWDSGALF